MSREFYIKGPTDAWISASILAMVFLLVVFSAGMCVGQKTEPHCVEAGTP